jgi:very-short-patch-repair endonuclease
LKATWRDGIPTTTVADTIIDLAARLPRDDIETMIGEADIQQLISPISLRRHLDHAPGRRGVGAARSLLDTRTFRLTRSKLERLFIPIAHAAGLPTPRTRARVNGYEVDFHWPELGLVVETDGLQYHRTPAQQAKDRLRDQTHAAAGLTPLRFTHAQVRHEPDHVGTTLRAVAGRVGTTLRAVAGRQR